jgi:hypothetical protein
MLKGSPTTFDAKPASKATATSDERYILSVVDESKMTFALSFCAACVITSAYAFAVNAANLSFYF